MMNHMGIKDEFLQDLLFNKIVSNKEKTEIGFEEFLSFLSVFLKGDARQKLKCEISFNINTA